MEQGPAPPGQELGSLPGQRTLYSKLLGELPFGTYATMKRAFSCFAHMAEAVEDNNTAALKGHLAQAMRWVALHVESPRDPLTAWGGWLWPLGRELASRGAL